MSRGHTVNSLVKARTGLPAGQGGGLLTGLLGAPEKGLLAGYSGKSATKLPAVRAIGSAARRLTTGLPAGQKGEPATGLSAARGIGSAAKGLATGLPAGQKKRLGIGQAIGRAIG